LIKTITKRDEFLNWRDSVNAPVGLVPTMGNLHAGHLSLISESLENYDVSVVTIFVNPKQFGQGEDFDQYPRTLSSDIEKIEKLAHDNKTLVIFAPESDDEIYPDNFSTTISVSGLTGTLCGLSRPDHFDGVTTVVYQLFALTKPKTAFFGLKDYQQVMVIKKMVRDLMLPITIKAMPIVREESGLALSSRNQYLSTEGREKSLELSHTLQKLAGLIKVGQLNQALEMAKKTDSENHWDYLNILDGDKLLPVDEKTQTVLLAGAMYVDETRLIDNLTVEIQ
jgi:pantoate--beta-alanine ligase